MPELRRLNLIEGSEMTFCNDKCEFGHTKVRVLGGLTSGEGIKPDPSKVKVILDKQSTSCNGEARFTSTANSSTETSGGEEQRTGVTNPRSAVMEATIYSQAAAGRSQPILAKVGGLIDKLGRGFTTPDVAELRRAALLQRKKEIEQQYRMAIAKVEDDERQLEADLRREQGFREAIRNLVSLKDKHTGELGTKTLSTATPVELSVAQSQGGNVSFMRTTPIMPAVMEAARKGPADRVEIPLMSPPCVPVGKREWWRKRKRQRVLTTVGLMRVLTQVGLSGLVSTLVVSYWMAMTKANQVVPSLRQWRLGTSLLVLRVMKEWSGAWIVGVIVRRRVRYPQNARRQEPNGRQPVESPK